MDSFRFNLRACLLTILASFALCLAGCQTVPEAPPTTPLASRALPVAAPAANAVRYKILADRSAIRFLVFRAGALAKLGHNHVIEARNFQGEILLAPNIQESIVFIVMPVKDFQVDSETARREEGDDFSPQPDEDAVAGTTRNMLGEKVLDAANYPTIEIRSIALRGQPPAMEATMRINLHGVERDLMVPSVVEMDNNQLVVSAFFSIRQTDFGITPMTVLGGALQVDNSVKVRLRIVAGKDDTRQQ